MTERRARVVQKEYFGWAAGITQADMCASSALTREELGWAIGREFVTDDSAARRELGYVGRVSRAEGLTVYGGVKARSSDETANLA